MSRREKFETKMFEVEYQERTINKSFDAESYSEWEISIKKIPQPYIKITAVFDTITTTVVWGKRAVNLPNKLGEMVWRWANTLLEDEYQRQTESWLKATDGEYNHDPMEDLYGRNY